MKNSKTQTFSRGILLCVDEKTHFQKSEFRKEEISSFESCCLLQLGYVFKWIRVLHRGKLYPELRVLQVPKFFPWNEGIWSSQHLLMGPKPYYMSMLGDKKTTLISSSLFSWKLGRGDCELSFSSRCENIMYNATSTFQQN